MRHKAQIFRKSITWRLVGMMVLLMTLFFGGLAFMSWDENRSMNEFQNEADRLAVQQRLVSELAQHINGILYNSRGYFVNLNVRDYSKIYAGKEGLEETLAAFGQLRLEPEVRRWVESADAFFRSYFDVILPQALELSSENDYESLRELTGQTLDSEAGNLISESFAVQQKNQADLEQAQAMLDRHLAGQFPRLALYSAALLLIAFLVVFKTAKDISRPISKLSAIANRFYVGSLEKFPYTSRSDEIGGLARSLETMTQQIQSKEEELLAQNEELQAQQDELQMQQEELTEALFRMEDNEKYLKKRNRLVQSLAITLNRDEMLRSIVRHMAEILEADKGIIVLLGANRDYASFGLSDEEAERFLRACDEGHLARLLETKLPYHVQRTASLGERGYHSETMQASDLYIPILDGDGAVVACIVLTRSGKTFTVKETDEAEGFAIQISLSLDKLNMYEHAENQRRLTQNMLDTIQEAIQMLDGDGATIQVNSNWFQMFGVKARPEFEMDLEAFYELVKPLVKHPEPLIRFIDGIVRNRDDKELDLLYEMTSPVRRYIHMYFEPLYQGRKRLGALLVHRDVTREYEADQLKSEFVSTVSHELRTPLASVLGFAELLLHKQLAPERQKKYIHTIHQEANRLTALINDFLDLQRMESGKMAYEFRTLSFAKLIGETIDLHKINAPRHRFVFEDLSGGTKVKADEGKLKQVLMNIIGNAVKYSPEGGTIAVSAAAADNFLRVEIADEGLGIPEEALPMLFQKFYRVDNTDRREIGGTGLGLAIVKEIMAIHGGDVQVASEYGRGSTFTLLLPIAGGGPAAGYSAENSEKTALVYIAEDDENLSVLLSEELTGNGYAVTTFASGEEAIAAMEISPPDALVLDLMFKSGIGGLEVIERMKRDDRLKDVSILISSAFEEEARAAELGAKGYLVKPYRPNKLSEELMRLLESERGNGHIWLPDRE